MFDGASCHVSDQAVTTIQGPGASEIGAFCAPTERYRLGAPHCGTSKTRSMRIHWQCFHIHVMEQRTLMI